MIFNKAHLCQILFEQYYMNDYSYQSCKQNLQKNENIVANSLNVIKQICKPVVSLKFVNKFPIFG
jgi:hypothetical protein